jgi:hypothetical protein
MDKMEFEEALEVIRKSDFKGLWESFIRVEYGEDWMRSAWKAYCDMTSEDWSENASKDDIVAPYIRMINDEFR